MYDPTPLETNLSAKSAVLRVWTDFRPVAGLEKIECNDDGTVTVTTEDTAMESFSMDLTDEPAVFAWKLADRLQTILMESRQRFVPPCPLHPERTSAH
jgi:hypothetical protein